jgi:hypothetical protein
MVLVLGIMVLLKAPLMVQKVAVSNTAPLPQALTATKCIFDSKGQQILMAEERDALVW